MVLPLFCLSAYSQAAEIDPLGIYEISGAQLITLETERLERETIINELSKRIEIQSDACETAINDLEASSMMLSEKALSAEIRAGRFRDLSIVLGATTAGGVLFMLFTIFGNTMVIR